MTSTRLPPMGCLLMFVIMTCGFTPSILLGQADPAERPEPASASLTDEDADDLPDRVEVDDVAEDDAIRNRLVSILTATDRYRNLEVSVRDSVVFLRGSTRQESYREWAGLLAQKTDSVAAVVNDISVTRQLDLKQAMKIIDESLTTMWQDFLERSPLMFAALLVLMITWGVSGISHLIFLRFLDRSRLRISLKDLVRQLMTIGIWLFGITVAAVIVFPGMTPARILTVLGLSSVAVGFAFKDIFENFFAGILILWRYPFDRGDFIACEGIEGRIEEITIRMAMIRQVDGQLVVVPNSFLFKNPVDVLTNRRTRRLTVICGVAYDTDLARAREVIRQAVSACESVNQHQPIEVFAHAFGASSIDFEVTWWTDPTPVEFRISRDEVVSAVKVALNDAGIEIPFPQTTLWFRGPLTTRVLAEGE